MFQKGSTGIGESSETDNNSWSKTSNFSGEEFIEVIESEREGSRVNESDNTSESDVNIFLRS